MSKAIATLTHRLPASTECVCQDTVVLTAEERRRSRYHCKTQTGAEILLALPRGTLLKAGDRLTTEQNDLYISVAAQPEPVLIVKGQTPLDLLRAAYHLGNRHVTLAIASDYLMLAPDPVLLEMLNHLGLEVEEAILPFEPETGAYGHSH